MADFEPSRRQFSIGIATAFGVSLAGCNESSSDDDGSADENETTTGDETEDETESGNGTETESDGAFGQEEEENPEVTLSFENEDGEPVSVGMDVQIEHQSASSTWSRSFVSNPEERDDISEGRVTMTIMNSGTQTITVEPNEEGDFETQETEFTFTESEIEENVTKEVTFVLEGAVPDSERFETTETPTEEE